MDTTQQVISETFAREADRILASLIGTVRDFELAEDALQDALLVALEHWPIDGIPRNPGAWIMATARHKAIDRLRRESTLARKAAMLATLLELQVERAEDTDWPQIAALYHELMKMIPSPVIELNRAVALAMADGPLKGLKLLDQPLLKQELSDYYLFHAARADLLRRLGRMGDAGDAYTLALNLCQNERERAFLRHRLVEVSEQER